LRRDGQGRPVEPIYQLADHLPEALMRYDLRFRRTYLNPGWESVTGVSAESALGKSLDEWPCPLDGDRIAFLEADTDFGRLIRRFHRRDGALIDDRRRFLGGIFQHLAFGR